MNTIVLTMNVFISLIRVGSRWKTPVTFSWPIIWLSHSQSVPSRPLGAPEILSESERSNFSHNDIKMVFARLFFWVMLLTHFAMMVQKSWQWELRVPWHRPKQWPWSVLVVTRSSPLCTHSEKNTSWVKRTYNGPCWSSKNYKFCSVLSLEYPHFEYFRWQSERDTYSTAATCWSTTVQCLSWGRALCNCLSCKLN